MTAIRRLSKDQIQKVILSAIGFVFLLYVYFTFFLGPLSRSRATMEQTMVALQNKLGSSKTEMRRTASLEHEAGAATARYAALQALAPDGAPLAWFPPRIKTFFANEGIDKAAAQLGSSDNPKEPELSGWSRYTWMISLPEADYAALGKAVANLENSEPLLAIDRLTIRTQIEQPQFQQVEIVATNTIQKR